ncbi:TetR family transcriptional regulator C-terminal domain-containing protein [Planotetraspora silvatica]|uniref:TetR family transcriptional regulator C-terminal domain-containing protein n=1 Tax=Planotetraspora silvatica TaxID=234614 RepID=UPI00357112DD
MRCVRRDGLHDDAGYRCPLGSLANEFVGRSGHAHRLLAAAFDSLWDALAGGLARLQEEGELGSEVTAEELALGVIAALQGGYLLAESMQDDQPFRLAIDMALSWIRALGADRWEPVGEQFVVHVVPPGAATRHFMGLPHIST